MVFMLEIVIIAVIIFLTVLFVAWVDYPTYYKDLPKIKFEAFKKFYSINPDRWNLEDGYVACKIENDRKQRPYGGLFYDYKKEGFCFGFFDWLKYTDFCRELETKKQDTKHMKATSEMIRMVKKDIENMEALAQQQKKQAAENLDAILKNL